nr:MAG TPA: hypothetical protein [Caudoviricetes sp.]
MRESKNKCSEKFNFLCIDININMSIIYFS